MPRKLDEYSIARLALLGQGFEGFSDIEMCWVFVAIVVYENCHQVGLFWKPVYIYNVVL